MGLMRIGLLTIGVALGLSALERNGLIMDPTWQKIFDGIGRIALPIAAFLLIFFGVCMRDGIDTVTLAEAQLLQNPQLPRCGVCKKVMQISNYFSEGEGNWRFVECCGRRLIIENQDEEKRILDALMEYHSKPAV